MILQGNQRGRAKDLALHLLKDENDHVEIHELRGFVVDDLVGAPNEAYAVSRGTKAKQFLFSLSLNPSPEEKVSTADFKAAIDRVEDKLGLTGQPRAIVFHEKNGRHHCQAVWSRTDIEKMKAIQLSHTKRKLQKVSRELYIEHGWQMPRGFMESRERDPRNQQALKERGYTLARGDRRGFVVLDHRCEVFSVSRWIDIRAKGVRAKLSAPATLPSVGQAKDEITKDMQARLTELRQQYGQAVKARMGEIAKKTPASLGAAKNRTPSAKRGTGTASAGRNPAAARAL